MGNPMTPSPPESPPIPQNPLFKLFFKLQN